MNPKIINILHMLVKNQNWTKFANQCQNFDTMLFSFAIVLNSWEICHRCAKILLAAEHKMQLAYYLRNTDWFQKCSEFGFFDEPFLILFTIFY